MKTNKPTTPVKPRQTWIIEDHLCRHCGGRILRCVTGNGITAGGNPIYKCADCGKSRASMGPLDLCWCGFSHRQNHGSTAYVCVAFSILKERPWLKHEFAMCGCDSTRGEVGIMLRESLSKPNPKPEVTCPKCNLYMPGHATGAGDICTCSHQ